MLTSMTTNEQINLLLDLVRLELITLEQAQNIIYLKDSELLFEMEDVYERIL